MGPDPEKRNVIYLVRHGEAMGNVRRVFLPPNEDVLSPDGWNQAQLLGKHLSEVRFTRVYSSNYKRALDTTDVILNNSKASKNIPFNIEPRLRERYYGHLEGQPYKEYFERLHDSKASSPFEFDVPGGEKIFDVVSRVHAFFQELCEGLENNENAETVLVVSHSFALVLLLRHLSSSKNYELFNWSTERDLRMMGNASYMKIDIGKSKKPTDNLTKKLTFLKVHETTHLSPLLSTCKGSFSKFIEDNKDCKGFGDNNAVSIFK